jgi:hypothetical protein
MDQLLRLGARTNAEPLKAAQGYEMDPLDLVRAIDVLISVKWISEIETPLGVAYVATQMGKDCRGMLPPFIANVVPVSTPWGVSAPASISTEALRRLLEIKQGGNKCE